MRHNPAAWEALAQMADLSRNDARDRLLTEVRIEQGKENDNH
jgi:hypothetical protein